MVAILFPCGPAGSVNLAPTVSWTPADLGSALRLWIKADTGTSVTGSLIDSIADQSGNGFNLGSLTTHRPTLNATGYNSLPSIDFTASNTTYLNTARDVALSMGSSSSWFFIGQMDTGTASFGRIFSYLGATAAAGSAVDYNTAGCVAAILRNASTNALCMYQVAAAAGASGSVSLNTNMRVLMVFDNVNATLYINNVQAAQTSCSFTLNSSGNICIGGDPVTSSGTMAFPATCWDGTVAEALVTNTALNSTERGNLDTYVVARLGA